jgi:hypothetical protein
MHARADDLVEEGVDDGVRDPDGVLRVPNLQRKRGEAGERKGGGQKTRASEGRGEEDRVEWERERRHRREERRGQVTRAN